VYTRLYCSVYVLISEAEANFGCYEALNLTSFNPEFAACEQQASAAASQSNNSMCMYVAAR